jgi:hypothetical protein
MKKRSKLMIYVRAELAPDAIRWAIRLSQTTPTFCSQCVGYSLQNMERGLNVFRDGCEHLEITAGQDIQDEASRSKHSTGPCVAAKPVPPGLAEA